MMNGKLYPKELRSKMLMTNKYEISGDF